ncbi:hypothetical protein QJT78_51875, partial [Bradyrhizobium sp. Mp27]|nr:hypothetical protein [Bradyrhizobium sp. Mp27]
LGHGVSLSSRGSGRLVTRLDTPPSSHRHHPDSAIAPHMVADHQKDIAEYKKASKSKDAAGEYASGQIDTLQKHLDTAKSLKAGN